MWGCRRLSLIAAPVVGIALLSACTQPPGTILREKQVLANGQLITTDARQRAITSQAPDISTKPGVVVPSNITCVEPQPSVALALANGLSVGVSVFGEGSGALSDSVSEGVFQLDERTIAIQALLNAGYQNCLDYSNGAITNTFYAIRASNLDNLLVTMTLASEAAGNLRSSLGSVGTQASAEAKASQAFLANAVDDIQKSAKALGDARRNTEDKRETLATKKAALADAHQATEQAKADEAQAKADGKTDAELKPFTDKVTEAASKEAAAKTEFDTAEREFKQASDEQDAIENGMLNQIDATASSEAATKEVRGAGGVTGRPTDTAVLTMGEMQRRFLERSTASQNITACLVELGLATAFPEETETQSAATETTPPNPTTAQPSQGAVGSPTPIGKSNNKQAAAEEEVKPIPPGRTFERDLWPDAKKYLKDKMTADQFGQNEASTLTMFTRSERDSQLAQFCKTQLPGIVTSAQANEQELAKERVKNERLQTALQLLQTVATLGQQCDALHGATEPETTQLRNACHNRLERIQKYLDREFQILASG